MLGGRSSRGARAADGTGFSGPDRRPRPRRAARGLGAIAVCLICVIAACSGDGHDLTAPDDNASDAVTSTTMDPRSPAVLEAYMAYWTAFLAAADPPVPESEQLAQHATGDELEEARSAIAALQGAGDVLRGRYEHSASVASIEDGAAIVADCLAPRTTTLDAATGDVIVGESGGSGLVTVRMTLEGDAWKVASIDDGEGACPSAGQAPAAGAAAGG